MKRLAYTKLKLFGKLKHLYQALPDLDKIELPPSCIEVKQDLDENYRQSLSEIKSGCSANNMGVFIICIEELLLFNNDRQVLIDHCFEEEVFSEDLYQKLNEIQLELRELIIMVFNQARAYFENGEVPEGWYMEVKILD